MPTTKAINHEELNLAGLETLMSLYSDSLFMFVFGIIKNKESAEELVSDVFVKLWNNRDQYQAIRNIRSYLFISSRNESISFLRKKKHLKTISIDEFGDYWVTPLETDDSESFPADVVEKINAAIELLPSKCKMAFSLAKINGLKYKEIAEIMKISPWTVKNHVAYALEKICAHVGIKNNKQTISNSDIYLFFLLLRKL
ncbi:MAG: RNA polymerase sigma factor [Draconibacterium sp.]